MPVYEYECKQCGHEFEREQRISEPPAKKCPSCGALKAKRLISRTSFVLKGSGWYNDLYSSTKKGKAEGGGDSDSADKPADKSATPSDGKADSKPATKADASSGKTKGPDKGGKAKGKAAA